MNAKAVTTRLELSLVQVCACGFLHVLFQELLLSVRIGGQQLLNTYFVSIAQLCYF